MLSNQMLAEETLAAITADPICLHAHFRQGTGKCRGHNPDVHPGRARIRLDNGLRQITAQLRLLPSNKRRAVLENLFSELERRKLEQWMIQQRSDPAAVCITADFLSKEGMHESNGMKDAVACQCTPISVHAVNAATQDMASRVAHPTRNIQDAAARQYTPISVHTAIDAMPDMTCRVAKKRRKIQVDTSTPDAIGKRGFKPNAKVHSYTDKNLNMWYRAIVCIRGLRIETRCTKDLHLAREFSAALTRVQNAVAVNGIEDDHGQFAANISKALPSAMDERNLRGPDRCARLSFIVRVSTRCWTGGSLSSPRIKNLPDALEVWRLLREGPWFGCGNRPDLVVQGGKDRDDAWKKLCAMFKHLSAKFGHDRGMVEKRLARLHAHEMRMRPWKKIRLTQRSALLAESRERRRMCQAEQDTKRWIAASRRVELRRAASQRRVERQLLRLIRQWRLRLKIRN